MTCGAGLRRAMGGRPVEHRSETVEPRAIDLARGGVEIALHGQTQRGRSRPSTGRGGAGPDRARAAGAGGWPACRACARARSPERVQHDAPRHARHDEEGAAEPVVGLADQQHRRTGVAERGDRPVDGGLEAGARGIDLGAGSAGGPADPTGRRVRRATRTRRSGCRIRRGCARAHGVLGLRAGAPAQDGEQAVRNRRVVGVVRHLL